MEGSPFALTSHHGGDWWQDNAFSKDFFAADSDKKQPLLDANTLGPLVNVNQSYNYFSIGKGASTPSTPQV